MRSAVALNLLTGGIGLLINPTQAHQRCSLCVPLDNLLTEAYGIQVSEERVSSAVAFHNGSVRFIGSVRASQEYQDLMRPLLQRELGHEPRGATLNCPSEPQQQQIRYQSASPDDSYLYQFCVTISNWMRDLRERYKQKPEAEPAPLHPTAKIFKREFLKLAPFAEMTPEQLSKTSIGLQLPAWMPGLYESCHLIAAAKHTFGAVVARESPPSAAYTAAGYELCRISYDAFECNGPGHLMVLEYSDGLALASLVRTPLQGWASDPLVFSGLRSANSDQLAKWIDNFINIERPVKLMLAGTNIQDPALEQALSNSRAGQYLETHPSISAAEILIFGTAQEAKESLERQPTDCGEDERCIKIRKKADAIAGPRKWSHRPSRWARVPFDHEEL